MHSGSAAQAFETLSISKKNIKVLRGQKFKRAIQEKPIIKRV
jgi:hypothetical protein